jgi:hypothetical protein
MDERLTIWTGPWSARIDLQTGDPVLDPASDAEEIDGDSGPLSLGCCLRMPLATDVFLTGLVESAREEVA